MALKCAKNDINWLRYIKDVSRKCELFNVVAPRFWPILYCEQEIVIIQTLKTQKSLPRLFFSVSQNAQYLENHAVTRHQLLIHDHRNFSVACWGYAIYM